MCVRNYFPTTNRNYTCDVNHMPRSFLISTKNRENLDDKYIYINCRTYQQGKPNTFMAKERERERVCFEELI